MDFFIVVVVFCCLGKYIPEAIYWSKTKVLKELSRNRTHERETITDDGYDSIKSKKIANLPHFIKKSNQVAKGVGWIGKGIKSQY